MSTPNEKIKNELAECRTALSVESIKVPRDLEKIKELDKQCTELTEKLAKTPKKETKTVKTIKEKISDKVTKKPEINSN